MWKIFTWSAGTSYIFASCAADWRIRVDGLRAVDGDGL
jgi:hypothetical protein